MNDNVCQITIDNQAYYIHCDRINDLFFDGTYLVNISSSSLSMRSHFSPNTSYPYIGCSAMSVCQLKKGSGYESISVTNPCVYDGDLLKIVNFDLLIFATLFILLGVRLIWKK